MMWLALSCIVIAVNLVIAIQAEQAATVDFLLLNRSAP
jgi:hypothetical protein